MSLDYKLKLKNKEIWVAAGSGIYVRRDGRVVELPGDNDTLCKTSIILDTNITSNLSRMASAVSVSPDRTLQDLLWGPPSVLDAREVETYLTDLRVARNGLEQEKVRLVAEYSPKNGWGTFDNLYNLVSDIISAISGHPGEELIIETSY